MNYNELLDLVKKRRSIKTFKNDPIPEGYLEKMIEVAIQAPSGFNSQLWDFIVINEKDTKDLLLESLGIDPKKPNKGFANAPCYILILGDTRVQKYGPPHVQNNEEKFKNILYSSLGIAFQYMHLAAVTLGLSAQWISLVNRPEFKSNVKEALKIPNGYDIYELFVVGYSDEEAKPKILREKEKMIHYNIDIDSYRSEEEVKKYFK